MSTYKTFSLLVNWLRLKLVQLTWLAFGVAEGLLGLRFALKLMDANPDNVFAQLIYGATRQLMAPFNDLTVTPRVGGMAVEVNALIAMAVGALAAAALLHVVAFVFSQPAPARRVEQQQHQKIMERHIVRAPPNWFNKQP